jgi:hypothetical protein
MSRRQRLLASGVIMAYVVSCRPVSCGNAVQSLRRCLEVEYTTVNVE